MSDESLVAATLRGDDEAFGRLVRRYLRKAMAVAIEYARAREDAEDVVQETFRRVYGSLHRFEPGRAFGPWLFTILRNTARNAARSGRLREHEELPPEQPAPTAGPFEDARRIELRRRLVDAIDRLPPKQRRCVRLCMIEGLSSVEAARAVGASESTVRVHLHQARRTLRLLLEAWRGEGTSR